MSGCYLLAWSQICKSGRWGKGKGAAAAARHSVAMPIAGMGADFQDREAGQGNGGCSRRQPGTASGCHLLAWGRFARPGGGARGRGAADAAGHSFAMSIAGMGTNLPVREAGQGLWRQPGTASHCQLLAWGAICKSGRWGKGKGAAAAAGHSVTMPNAGMGADLQDREAGDSEVGLPRAAAVHSVWMPLAIFTSGRWGKG